jgi:hypothetical protein
MSLASVRMRSARGAPIASASCSRAFFGCGKRTREQEPAAQPARRNAPRLVRQQARVEELELLLQGLERVEAHKAHHHEALGAVASASASLSSDPTAAAISAETAAAASAVAVAALPCRQRRRWSGQGQHGRASIVFRSERGGTGKGALAVEDDARAPVLCELEWPAASPAELAAPPLPPATTPPSATEGATAAAPKAQPAAPMSGAARRCALSPASFAAVSTL